MDNLRKVLQTLVLSCSLLLAQVGQAVPITIAQEPLFLGGIIPPNIMFILDDSGSMQWENLPEDNWTYFVYPRAWNVYGPGNYTSYVPEFSDSLSYSVRIRSPHANKLYYNPETTYTPWVDANGAPYLTSYTISGNTYTDSSGNVDPTCAPHNPARISAGCRDLTSNNTQNSYWDSYNGLAGGFPWGVTTSGWQSRTFWPAVYYRYTGAVGNSTQEWTASNYTKVEIRPSVPTYTDGDRTGRTDCANAASNSCTYAEEIQNFANWYTYYRSRILLARNGIGKAFAAQSGGMRVGFAAINQGSATIDGFSSGGALVSGLRAFTPGTSDRTAFFDTLYDYTIGTSATPLRRALDDIGQYYEWDDNRGPWGKTPGTNDTRPHPECRQSFSVLMTDGYWNFTGADAPANGNVDNANGPTIANPSGGSYQYTPSNPYRDSWSGTLADVAMYYWNHDLRTDLENKVPTSTQDEAFWQHMVTYTVGLGVTGTLDPDTDLPALTGGTLSWPQASIGAGAANIDDLWHAALNSRGGFFSASDPTRLASQLANVLTSIGQRISSAASLATNSTRLNSSTYVYQARFDSSDWHGQLLAYQVNQSTADVDSSATWDAGNLIPSAGSRNILTFDLSLNSGVDFTWNGLNTSEQAYLIDGGTAADGQARLAYLRGDQNNEVKNGGAYRNRSSVLGDIVNSDPWYVGQQNFGYYILPGTEGSSYLSFRASSVYTNRSKVIYVGANDGMLHAFNAATGEELFAYVPAAVFPNLADLTDPNYAHKYFVDGSPKAGDAYVGGSWKTILVGTLGGGGKAVFALDVTDPDNMTASEVLWEITDTTPETIDNNGDSMLGYTLGQASIVRMYNGHWAAIFGNGYNSAANRAVLFIKDLNDGTLMAFDTEVGDSTHPNGMSTPFAADTNDDGIVDAIYAGDLQGNVWKVDVSDSHTNQWDFDYHSGGKPAPLFTASDASSNPQPITAKVEVGTHPSGGVMVYFGTGKYIETSDVTSTDIQTLYGIRDDGTQVSGRSALAKQEILQRVSQTFTTPGGSTETRNLMVTTANPVDYTASGLNQKGWYMDLVTPTSLGTDANGNLTVTGYSQDGERVVANPMLLEGGRIVFTTMIPDPDPCNFGGTSWTADLTAIDGSRPSVSPYDLNSDGSFDSDDYVQVSWDVNGDGVVDANDKIVASGKESRVGITKNPAVIRVGDRAYRYAGGSTGDIEKTTGARTAESGRQSWRQIR